MSPPHTPHDPPPEPTNSSTEWPWEEPGEKTPRDRVVRILAEGIWEMVLAGKSPLPGTSRRLSSRAADD